MHHHLDLFVSLAECHTYMWICLKPVGILHLFRLLFSDVAMFQTVFILATALETYSSDEKAVVKVLVTFE